MPLNIEGFTHDNILGGVGACLPSCRQRRTVWCTSSAYFGRRTRRGAVPCASMGSWSSTAGWRTRHFLMEQHRWMGSMGSWSSTSRGCRRRRTGATTSAPAGLVRGRQGPLQSHAHTWAGPGNFLEDGFDQLHVIWSVGFYGSDHGS
jgi:hypothetical protein